MVMLQGKVLRVAFTQSDGTTTEFAVDGITHGLSEANREGVEGEPQATPGGLPGSPRIGSWCCFCGSTENPFSDICVMCWADSMSGQIEVTGRTTQEFTDAMKKLGDSLSFLTSAMHA